MLILPLPNMVTRRREYMRRKMQEYRKNRPRQYGRYVENQLKRRKKFRDTIVLYLGSCCSICGNRDRDELEIIKLNRTDWRLTLQRRSDIKLWHIFSKNPHECRSHLKLLCLRCRYPKKFGKLPEPQQSDQLATECGHL